MMFTLIGSLPAGSSQPQHIIKLAQLLQKLPQDDPTIVTSVATQVEVALQGPDPVAAHSSQEIAATLQCAGWLLQATKGSSPTAQASSPASRGNDVMAEYAAQLCVAAAHDVLKGLNPPGMGLEVLQAVLQPGPGSRVPGGWC
jgi:hypothetical protein